MWENMGAYKTRNWTGKKFTEWHDYNYKKNFATRISQLETSKIIVSKLVARNCDSLKETLEKTKKHLHK